MITAALLFPGHKAIFHQLDHAALAVAPVQVQVFGHLSRGAAGMFAHVDHKIHHAKAQAKLLQLLGGVGCELLVKLHHVEGYGRLDHSLHPLYLTRSSIITSLDKVKCFFQKNSPCSVFLFREQGESDSFASDQRHDIFRGSSKAGGCFWRRGRHCLLGHLPPQAGLTAGQGEDHIPVKGVLTGGDSLHRQTVGGAGSAGRKIMGADAHGTAALGHRQSHGQRLFPARQMNGMLPHPGAGQNVLAAGQAGGGTGVTC